MLQRIPNLLSSSFLGSQRHTSASAEEYVSPLSVADAVERRSTFSATTLIALFMYILYLAALRYKRPRAPGPAGLPLLGNTLQLPRTLQFLRYCEWAEKYGSFYSLNLLGQQVLVVNDHKSAIDLLESRSRIYSGRPRLVLVDEILTQHLYLGFIRHGDLWRRMRRATQASFSAKAVRKYEPFQMRSAAQAVALTISKPDKWEKNLDIFAISSMFTSVYGRFLEPDSALIGRAKAHINHIMESTTPAFHWYELFPILKHVPAKLARWKREALEWHDNEDQFFKQLSAEANAETFDKANAELNQRGFVADLLQTGDTHGLSDKQISWLAGSMLGVGADTTSVAITNFLLAMLNYPEVMRKAHAEIDAVVGRGRIPTFDDLPNLPYLRAMVKETLRWRPVAPLATLHTATEDDHYEGYFIPKDTIVVANIWNMNRDPELYPDFDKYRPERFLNEAGDVEIVPPGTHNMGHVTYGFGRRNCIGMHFANQSLFIMMATMLWAVEILPPIDATGNTVVPPTDKWIDDGIIVRSAPFDCRFLPRFSDALAILEASTAAA